MGKHKRAKKQGRCSDREDLIVDSTVCKGVDDLWKCKQIIHCKYACMAYGVVSTFWSQTKEISCLKFLHAYPVPIPVGSKNKHYANWIPEQKHKAWHT